MMRGPKHIIELDGIPRDRWRLRHDAAHLWRGRLWHLESVGCVLCINQGDREDQTLSSDIDGDEEIVCLTHGRLVEIPYVMEKHYTLTIGETVRRGSERVSDTFLFPASMSREEVTQVVERLLDEAEQEECDDVGASS